MAGIDNPNGLGPWDDRMDEAEVREALDTAEAMMASVHQRGCMERVLQDIRDERDRQIAKFGDQSGRPWDDEVSEGAWSDGMRAAGASLEMDARSDMMERPTWANILGEEVGEALQESMGNPDKLRGELVQVAAVAVAAIEALDRKALGTAAEVPRG